MYGIGGSYSCEVSHTCVYDEREAYMNYGGGKIMGEFAKETLKFQDKVIN